MQIGEGFHRGGGREKAQKELLPKNKRGPIVEAGSKKKKKHQKNKSKENPSLKLRERGERESQRGENELNCKRGKGLSRTSKNRFDRGVYFPGVSQTCKLKDGPAANLKPTPGKS